MSFSAIWSQFKGLLVDSPMETIKEGAQDRLTDAEFLAAELLKWLHSPVRLAQLRGRDYYCYNFKEQVRVGADADGMPVAWKNQPLSVFDNLYANMVDQKVNYILGKPFAIQTDDEAYLAELNGMFDKSFRRTLNNVATDCLTSGISWLHPFYDEKGILKFKQYKGYEVLPFWVDEEHTRLDLAIRYYTTIAYEGHTEKVVQHVEVFAKEGIKRYLLEGGTLIPDVEAGDSVYATYTAEDGTVQALAWDRIPLVAFKYNQHEIPLLRRVESLQDSINAVRSNWQKNMSEDIRDAILVLRNYDGENVADFRRKLMDVGAVKVVDDGGIDVLRIERDSVAYIEYLDKTKKALVENARGFDAKDERVGNNPNEMNLRSMYSDIDLDADMLEVNFQAAFDDLLFFVDSFLAAQGKGDYTGNEITLTFDRNMIVNDADVINNIKNSVGLVSNETLLARHPFVADVQMEQARLDKEGQEQAAGFDYLGGVGFGKADSTAENA